MKLISRIKIKIILKFRQIDLTEKLNEKCMYLFPVSSLFGYSLYRYMMVKDEVSAQISIFQGASQVKFRKIGSKF